MKTTLLFITIVGILAFTSCGKSYSCKCTALTTYNDTLPDNKILSITVDSLTSTSGKISKRKSNEYCKDMEYSKSTIKTTDSTYYKETLAYTCEGVEIPK
jgi:hypothetical protein